MKDLSKEAHSATSVFIAALDEIEKVRKSEDSEAEQLDYIRNYIIREMCKHRADAEKLPDGISQNYITNTRIIIFRQDSIDGIVKYLNNAIEKGKSYSEPETNIEENKENTDD